MSDAQQPPIDTQQPLVIYHAHCVDGYTAAWAARRVLGDGARYLAANYGDALPVDWRGRIYFVDFSAPRAVLEQMGRTSAGVVVLDHHKTAAADLAEPIPGVETHFDMAKSGARLAWEYFYPQLSPIVRGLAQWAQDPEAPPALIRYVEDRDLWRWTLPHGQEAAAIIGATPKTWERWNDLAEEIQHLAQSDERVLERGRTILDVYDQQVTAAAAGLVERWRTGDGIQRIFYGFGNVTTHISAVAAKALADHPAWDFTMTYHDDFSRGRRVRRFSLRSRPGGFDVARLAQRSGGGGHQSAAGFEMPMSGDIR